MALESIGANLSTTLGTSLTPNASAHTKGAWVQLVASSSATAQGILVILSGISTSSASNYLVDIGIGAGGAETVAVANLPHAGPSTRLVSAYYMPLPIAAGTRVSARAQCAAASAGAVSVCAVLLEAASVDLQGCSHVTTYGANTGTTSGASLDPGGTLHTKGAWTQLAASTSRNIDWIVPMADNLNDTAQSVCEWFVDIGTGAAASEVVVVPNLQFQATALTDLKVPQAYPAIPVPRIASGTRLAARAQCNITTAGDRLLGLILVGADGTAGSVGSTEHAYPFIG
jgi:hypothetical protein